MNQNQENLSFPSPLLDLCRQTAPASLENYLDAGGFQTLQKTRDMADGQVLLELRASGARERGPDALPLFIKWQTPMPGDEACLVVDAREVDEKSLVGRTLLDSCPWGLLEACLIAAHLTRVFNLKVFLPPHLEEFGLGLEEACAKVRDRELYGERPLEIELTPAAQAPAAWPAGPALVQSLATWYQTLLVFRLGSTAYQALGRGLQSGSQLVTVGGDGLSGSRLLEIPYGLPLQELIRTAGGEPALAQAKFIALDQGAGGFLKPEEACLPLAPEEMAAAGLAHGPDTVWLMSQNRCVVYYTQSALTEAYGRALPGPSRERILHALRLVTQVSRGEGTDNHLEQLTAMAEAFRGEKSPAHVPLGSALFRFRSEWEGHVAAKGCPLSANAHRDQAPCSASCPAGIDIPGFMAQVGRGEYKEAVATIRRHNPLPYICGLVCPAPCENGCVREGLDSSISIRAMKAVAAKNALAEGGYPQPEKAPTSGRKVAVIGAGPAGLSAAYYLAVAGHQVTLLEAQEIAGGTMLMGIPAYRLPREVIAAEVQSIREAGVELVTGRELGRDFTVESLRENGYEAIFLGIGATCGYRLGIPGEENNPAVWDALTFLKGVALGQVGAPADKVVVVGGGNAAMDAARTCIRLGAKVTVAYRRTSAEMPAHHHEVNEAMEEGVSFVFLAQPLRVEEEGGRVTGLTCQQCELGPPDASGRRRPMPIEGAEYTLEAGAIIAAIGQTPELSCLGPLSEDQGVCSRRLLADGFTGATAKPWLFAGGDAVTGPATVVEAVAAGKRAAVAMDSYLRGGEVRDSPLLAQAPKVEPLSSPAQARSTAVRPHIPMRLSHERKHDFQAVELGLSNADATGEAGRCLRCDLCIGCGLCQLVCAEVGVMAIRMEKAANGRWVNRDFLRPAQLCVGCGSCANACPTMAMRLVDEDHMRRTMLTGTVLAELPLGKCSMCGEDIPPAPYIDRLTKRDRRVAADQVRQHVCAKCARELRASTMFL